MATHPDKTRFAMTTSNVFSFCVCKFAQRAYGSRQKEEQACRVHRLFSITRQHFSQVNVFCQTTRVREAKNKCLTQTGHSGSIASQSTSLPPPRGTHCARRHTRDLQLGPQSHPHTTLSPHHRLAHSPCCCLKETSKAL